MSEKVHYKSYNATTEQPPHQPTTQRENGEGYNA